MTPPQELLPPETWKRMSGCSHMVSLSDLHRQRGQNRKVKCGQVAVGLGELILSLASLGKPFDLILMTQKHHCVRIPILPSAPTIWTGMSHLSSAYRISPFQNGKTVFWEKDEALHCERLGRRDREMSVCLVKEETLWGGLWSKRL